MGYNATLAYKNNKVMTAQGAELTLMLYEGVIKFCNKAIIGFEKNNIGDINENIIKAERIIMEFRATLDFKYPVAKDFDEVYKLIHALLVDANIHKDINQLNTALDFIRQMRDTWKEVMSLARA